MGPLPDLGQAEDIMSVNLQAQAVAMCWKVDICLYCVEIPQRVAPVRGTAVDPVTNVRTFCSIVVSASSV